MDAGNEFRTLIGSGNALALLGIADIWEKRAKRDKPTNPIPRCTYVLRALKHPHEVDILKEIYGDAFLLMAVYSPHNARVEYLASRIAESRHDFQIERYRPTAESLILRDQEETESPLGQKVRRTFHRADVFINASSDEDIERSVARFVELLFGCCFHTPSKDEFGMFHARAAALRSADLSRQVGAAIATIDGDIVAVGTNDVPKAGGGLYWYGDFHDNRDFVLGVDSNDQRKRLLLADTINLLKEDKWLSDEKASIQTEELVKLALEEGSNSSLRRAQMMSLIEFGRAVHAEMAALMDAARRGVSVAGCTMYTTTFPCHLCARHIVASGINRVVYVEPYAKSLVRQLYPDSISVDEHIDDHVLFEPFVGVAPSQYMKLFSIGQRKNPDGSVVYFDLTSAIPRCKEAPIAYLTLENTHLDNLRKKMAEVGLEATEGGEK